MTKLIVLADQKQTDSFLKALAFVALCMNNQTLDTPIDLSKIAKNVEAWTKAAAPLLKRYNISLLLFDKLVETALEGEEEFNDQAKTFRKKMAAAAKQMSVDYRTVSDVQKQIMGALLTYFNSGSENAWKTLTNKVAELGSPSLTRGFHESNPEHETATDTSAQATLLAKLKKAASGVPHRSHETFLTARELQALEEKNPKAKEAYKEAYVELRKLFLTTLKAIVTSGNARYMPIPEVWNKMKAHGIKYNMFAVNAVHKGLFVNESGNIGITKDGDAASKTSIVNPTQTITINPKFDFSNPMSPTNGYIYSYQQTDQDLKPGMQNKVFGAKTASKNVAKRSANIKDLMHNIHDYVNKWRGDLDKPTLAGVGATIAEIAYLTSARLQAAGGESKGEATFGVLSWNVGHIVHISDKGVEFKFRAKSGKTQHIKLMVNKQQDAKDKLALSKALRNLMALKGKKKASDHLFTFKGQPVSLATYKTYMKNHVGYEGSLHKFRHVRGTKMFNELIAKAPFKKGEKPTSKQVADFFKQVMVQIGDTLGHKRTNADGEEEPVATTAMKYYVEPEPMAAYFEKYNMRPPTIITKRLEGKPDGDYTPPHVDEYESPTPVAKNPAKRTGKKVVEPEPESEPEQEDADDYDDETEGQEEPEPVPVKKNGKGKGKGKPNKGVTTQTIRKNGKTPVEVEPDDEGTSVADMQKEVVRLTKELITLRSSPIKTDSYRDARKKFDNDTSDKAAVAARNKAVKNIEDQISDLKNQIKSQTPAATKVQTKTEKSNKKIAVVETPKPTNTFPPTETQDNLLEELYNLHRKLKKTVDKAEKRAILRKINDVHDKLVELEPEEKSEQYVPPIPDSTTDNPDDEDEVEEETVQPKSPKAAKKKRKPAL